MFPTLKNLVLILVILLIGCKETDKSEPQNTIQKIEKKETESKKADKKVSKDPDSITNTTAVDFLIAYGKQHKENKVCVKTRYGNITVQLYDDVPLHRANFIFLTQVGYFNHTCFHRVVPDFIVQGGNSERPQALELRNKYENYTIPPEFKPQRKHNYGAIAAAREWENNPLKKSNPFEFYFIQDKKGAHHLNGEHTVFGEIIDGFDVLDMLAHVKTGRDEWPLEDVYMEIEVVK